MTKDFEKALKLKEKAPNGKEAVGGARLSFIWRLFIPRLVGEVLVKSRLVGGPCQIEANWCI